MPGSGSIRSFLGRKMAHDENKNSGNPNIDTPGPGDSPGGPKIEPKFPGFRSIFPPIFPSPRDPRFWPSGHRTFQEWEAEEATTRQNV